MDDAFGLAWLLPFWILIAGALWIGSTAWLDRDVRDAGRRRRQQRDGPSGVRAVQPAEPLT